MSHFSGLTLRFWPAVLVVVAGLLLGATAPSLSAQKAGTHERTLAIGKTKRQYILHVPRGYKKNSKKPLSLVLMLHGRGGNARIAASRYYGWKKLADQERFIVAFPSALGSPTTWKSGWRGQATEDSKFLAALIDALSKELAVDKNRVYMSGHSSGGFMSYSFATTHSDRVAAIGPVAGLRIGKTVPKVPISVISIHGIADKVVAYDQANGKKAKYKGLTSAMESAAFIAKHNGCKKSKRQDHAKGKVHIDTWTKGKNGVEVKLYSIKNGDHSWPRQRSHSLAATKLIWNFFNSHPRRPQTKEKENPQD
ncbi:MAG: PHB depolymerase family esterase [Planctomycetota bacterium]